MKEYPSIPPGIGTAFRAIPGAYIFDKLDGNNLRFEWSCKRGWYKQGSRRRLFDETDPILGPAIGVFKNTLAGPLHNLANKQRWLSVIVYCEYWSKNSLAGLHIPGEPKELTIFDAEINGKELLPPKDFIKIFKKMPTAKFLGQHNFTRGFVQDVYDGSLEGITFEGIVAKGLNGKKFVRAKAKTRLWLEAIKTNYSPEEAAMIVNS